MADDSTGQEGQPKAMDPAEEWRLLKERRRGYAIRMFKANAAGVAVGVAITLALAVGLFSVMEGGWDGSRPRSMARLLALLALPGFFTGRWVRNKLKVPNAR